MADRPIQIRCPGCGCLKAVPMAVGQQLQCHVCRTVFFAPVAEPGEPLEGLAEGDAVDGGWEDPFPHDADGATDSMDLGEPAAAAGPEAPVRQAEAVEPPDAASPPPAGEAPIAPDAPAAPPPAPAPGVAPRGEPQDVDASRRAAPQPRSAEPQANTAQPSAPESPSRIWTVLAPVATLVLLLCSVVVTLYLLRWFAGADAANRPFDSSRSPAPAAPVPVPPTWSDARRHAQRLGTVVCRVQAARYGPIRARDANNQLITTDDSQLLLVQLGLENRGREPVDFTSWYGNALDASRAGQVAELMDDRQRVYPLLKFEDVTRIEGQRFSAQIDPRGRATDAVVFEVPEDVDWEAIQYLRLTLPGAAVGSTGAFYFHIPVDMVEGLQEG